MNQSTIFNITIKTNSDKEKNRMQTFVFTNHYVCGVENKRTKDEVDIVNVNEFTMTSCIGSLHQKILYITKNRILHLQTN